MTLSALNPPDPAHEYEETNNRNALFFVGVIFTAIALVAIVLRAITLARRRRTIGMDDYFMLFAWISSIGFLTASAEAFSFGEGLGFIHGPSLKQEISAFKAIYAVEVFYYFSIYFIKMSILLLYLRLSCGLKNLLYKGTIVLMTVGTVHFMTTIIVEAVQCLPLARYWDHTVPGSCINITVFFYSTNVFTIITDCMMLALPIPTFWNINVSKRQKLGIVAVFLIGGMSTLASCIRLYSVRIYTESRHTPLRDAAPINIWSFIEIDVGILCACVPSIKALFVKPAETERRGQFFFAQNQDVESAQKHLTDDTLIDSKFTYTGTTITEVSRTEADRDTAQEAEPTRPTPARLSTTARRSSTATRRPSTFNAPSADDDLRLVPAGTEQQHTANAMYKVRTREDSVAGQIVVRTTFSVGSEHAEEKVPTERELACQMDRTTPLHTLQRLREHGRGSFPPMFSRAKRAGMRPTSRRYYSAHYEDYGQGA